LVALGQSVRASESISESIMLCAALRDTREQLAGVHEALLPLAQRIEHLCKPDAPAHAREGGLIRDGVDSALDEARLLQRDADAWLAQYQGRLIAEHNLPSLRVGYNKVFGYFIELPTAQARSAPSVLTRSQTLRNAERFTSPELRSFEQKVTTAESRAIEREKELFAELCSEGAASARDLALLGATIARVDVLLAFAEKAQHRAWVKPTMVDGPALMVREGRHPVLQESIGQRCVPNDCELGGSVAPLALITGPNMAGKSTFIRQAALHCLLAHAGSFVPAAEATIGLTDAIFTRLGADDALHAGQSTFMVEMIETAHILHHATARSLVILDEVGRGTSTLDGLSLAWAIVEHLAQQEGTPRALFATHYHELTELEARFSSKVRNLHVVVHEWPKGGEHASIVFVHRIEPGRSDRSYGVHVARLAGLPVSVVARAGEVLEGLEAQSRQPQGAKRARSVPAPRSAEPQLALFREFVNHPAIDALREVKLETLTPLQAFDALRRLHGLASESQAQES
jgi:DNA mismatch repair protein MutS